jgi:hypothetical protein
VAHVPLEQQSTTRLFLGFVGRIILPGAAVAGLICYCILQFGDSFGDLLSHLPFPL